MRSWSQSPRTVGAWLGSSAGSPSPGGVHVTRELPGIPRRVMVPGIVHASWRSVRGPAGERDATPVARVAGSNGCLGCVLAAESKAWGSAGRPVQLDRVL